MVNCCVPRCTNHSGKTKKGQQEVSYHKIPKDKHVSKVWLHRIKRQNMPPLENSYVCSDHFAREDFHIDHQAQFIGTKGKRKLKNDAIPSRFNFGTEPEAKHTRLSSEKRLNRREVSVFLHVIRKRI